MFYHEGNQEYLKYAILSAEKYNENVVLVGDLNNKSYCNNWYNAASFDLSRYEEFKKSYMHLSSNDENFEITCFKRYYILQQLFSNFGFTKCFLLDSDILTYIDFSTLQLPHTCEVACSINKNQDNYNWTASPHCSYWTNESLNNFIVFFEKIYRNSTEILIEKYNYHRNHHVKGGVCDMTLLYLWSKTKDENYLYNTAIEKQGAVMDHCINISDNFAQKEYKINKLLRIKSIKFIKNNPFFTKRGSGELIQAYILHFQGSAKTIMKDYYLGNFKYILYHRYKIYLEKLIKKYIFKRKAYI
jgi:hypothetical protein